MKVDLALFSADHILDLTIGVEKHERNRFLVGVVELLGQLAALVKDFASDSSGTQKSRGLSGLGVALVQPSDQDLSGGWGQSAQAVLAQ